MQAFSVSFSDCQTVCALYWNNKYWFFFFLFKDGPLVEGDITFTATTTIMVTIEDIDNRPPWFQPCNKFELTEGVVVCHSSGYTGSIVLNEKEVWHLCCTLSGKSNGDTEPSGDNRNEAMRFCLAYFRVVSRAARQLPALKSRHAWKQISRPARWTDHVQISVLHLTASTVSLQPFCVFRVFVDSMQLIVGGLQHSSTVLHWVENTKWVQNEYRMRSFYVRNR